MGGGGYDITETRDVLIPLPDGTRLAANLILPEGPPPAPAIVVYQPYLKDLSGRAAILAWQRHFARRGYACLTVDMRGTGASEGLMAPPFSASEREDAVPMLAWIAEQPWCDGTTGMWGISYSGSSALAAASLKPPSLKAIVPMHGTGNEFWGFLRPHGCRPAWWTEASWGPMMILLSLLPPLHRDPGRRWAKVWRERLDRLEPLPFIWHTTPYDTYMSWATDASKVEAALYAISGWHDYYPQATFDYFNAATGPKRILIGEWKHEFPDLAVRGGVDHLTDMDRWWDRWLRGDDNGIDREPPVLLWHQGADRWLGEAAWPPKASATTTWHAGADGRLSSEGPGDPGERCLTVDPTSGLDLLPWDPQAPVTPLPWDRSGDDHRGLCFDSPALDRDLDIAGSPVATVSLVSDVASFPLHAALCDVAPDGHATLICQGWVQTARLPSGPLRAGVAAEIAVPLYATCYRLAAGRRLRLVVTGTDFPLLWPARPNPRLTIQCGGAAGTRLDLPVAGADLAGYDSWSRPSPPAVTGVALDEATNRVWRELDGSAACFDQKEAASHKLDDGTVVHMERHNWSNVAKARPEDAVFSARMTARVEREPDPVHVVVETVQTVDNFHVDARIDLAGRPYFHRSWDLALDEN